MTAPTTLVSEIESLADHESRRRHLARRRSEITEAAVDAFRFRVDELIRQDAEQARELAEIGCEAAEITGRPESIGRANRALGYASHALGRYPDAVSSYERAVDRFEQAGLADEAVRTRVALVDALMYVSRHEDAVRIAKQARRQLPFSKRPKLRAKLEWNLGNVHHRMDRYDEALACYARARRYFSREGLAFQVAVLDLNRAVVLTVANEPDKALRLFRRARRVFEAEGLRAVTAQLDYNLSYLHFLRGRQTEALALLDRVGAEFEELSDRRHLALTKMDRAEILLRLNLRSDAGEYARAAADGFRRIGMRFEEGKCLLFAASAALARGEPASGERMVVIAAEIFDEEGNEVWAATARGIRAEALLRTGRPEEAARLADEVRSTFRSLGVRAREAWADLIAANAAVAAGRPGDAEELYRSALSGAEETRDLTTRFRAHQGLGRLRRDAGRVEEAREEFRLAIAIVEEMRGGIGGDELRASFLEDKLEVYEDMVLACVDQDQIVEALGFAERAKSRALVDLLAGRAISVAEDADDEVLRRIRELGEELSFLYNRAHDFEAHGDQRSLAHAEGIRAEIERAEREMSRVLRRLEVRSPELAALSRVPPILHDPTDLAPPGTSLLEYFTAGDRILVFCVREGRTNVVELPASRVEVVGLVDRLSFQVTKFNLGAGYVQRHREQLAVAVDSLLERLFRSLLAPVLRDTGDDRLIVVPHGPLHGVPFHALMTGDGPVLADREVSYAPSAEVLRLCRSRAPTARGPALLVGVEDAKAPAIGEEIRAIREALPNATVLRNGRATRSALIRRAGDARLIHLATHGVFREDNPTFSSLRLGDSWLGLFDIYRLTTGAELVTLSACESGLARVRAGDELFGLSRGFFYAGTPTILASLWRVDDTSTAEFMRDFYRAWGKGRSPASAAREASLALRERRSHPYYWAPFVVLGQPDRCPPPAGEEGGRRGAAPPVTETGPKAGSG